jgi:hypothetical protein
MPARRDRPVLFSNPQNRLRLLYPAARTVKPFCGEARFRGVRRRKLEFSCVRDHGFGFPLEIPVHPLRANPRFLRKFLIKRSNINRRRQGRPRTIVRSKRMAYFVPNTQFSKSPVARINSIWLRCVSKVISCKVMKCSFAWVSALSRSCRFAVEDSMRVLTA